VFWKPVKPPYDPLEWAQKPFAERSRLVCLAWAMQGYGTPIAVYIVYALKVLVYIGGWVLFCSFTPGMGGLADIATWWLRTEAFQKAILWSMLFEILGLGCGSGPLTGRYFPALGWSTSVGVVSRVMAFRLMHLHGRALSTLVPRAVVHPEAYEWVDGEVVAGMVLGWNFGEGHLHSEQLLHTVQDQCSFDEGELRCIMVESQPLGRHTLHYRIRDAKTGELEHGEADVRELRKLQPWAASNG
jgi:hypothetical protein